YAGAVRLRCRRPPTFPMDRYTMSKSRGEGHAPTRRNLAAPLMFVEKGCEHYKNISLRVKRKLLPALQVRRASFHMLRMSGILGGIKKGPHAELVEARSTPIQPSWPNMRLR